MNSIKVLAPGLLTTIQDFGRTGCQQYGIPAAGAMDRYSLQLANILVGNESGEAAIEMTMAGPAIEFQSSMAFSVTGADMAPSLNGIEIDRYKTLYANRGDVLRFSNLKTGLRAYLAIEGGFEIQDFMGSKSTYLKGEFGGFQGRKLREGDIIPVNKNNSGCIIGVRRIPDELKPEYKAAAEIRVITGPEERLFTEEGIEAFYNCIYTLTGQCDRMGIRLDGPQIKHSDGADIISSGINLGTVQVAGDGKPIVLMADRQTTGGYTRIANVVTVDIPYLAQLKPGDTVRFRKVSVEEAHALIRTQEEQINGLVEYFDRESSRLQRAERKFSIRVNGREFTVSAVEIPDS